MKKLLLNSYLVFSAAFLMTLASWLTWGSSCQDVWATEGGDSYSGMCAGDGIQYVGVFLTAVVVSVVFITISKLVMRLLGYKISRIK